jgi:hypothetical protein
VPLHVPLRPPVPMPHPRRSRPRPIRLSH